MPIHELPEPEVVKDSFGQDLQLTHIFIGVHVDPHEVNAFSIKGLMVAERFVPFEPSREHESFKTLDYERLLKSNPKGNDFRISDAHNLLKERKAERHQHSKDQADLIELQRGLDINRKA